MAADDLNEYDRILDREEARERWAAMFRADFEQLVDLVKRGVTPAYEFWRRRWYGHRGDE